MDAQQTGSSRWLGLGDDLDREAMPEDLLASSRNKTAYCSGTEPPGLWNLWESVWKMTGR